MNECILWINLLGMNTNEYRRDNRYERMCTLALCTIHRPDRDRYML